MNKLARRNVLVITAAVATILSHAAADADTWAPANAHVTQIASTQLFIQNAVIFKLDQGTSDCGAGSYIYYYSTNTDVLKEIYATVLAAYEAGTPLMVHFPNSCTSDAINAGS